MRGYQSPQWDIDFLMYFLVSLFCREVCLFYLLSRKDNTQQMKTSNKNDLKNQWHRPAGRRFGACKTVEGTLT